MQSLTPDQRIMLGRSILLNGLSPALAERILAGCRVRDLDAGETIFLQGEPADAVFVILSGWVKLYRIAPSGAEAVVAILTRGRSFAEAVALRGAPYPVSAEAISEASVVRLDGAGLRRMIAEDPAVALSLMAGMTVHLQRLVEQVEQLKARSGVQRVAEFLVTLADCGGPGGCRVTLPYNKALIASYLGMQPESLSRSFSRLRDYGVQVVANEARIADIDALQRLVEQDRVVG